MDEAFKKIKVKSESGEAFRELQSFVRYNLGTHKRTRLKKAGVEKSGSLLHVDVAKKHGEKLTEELKVRAKKAGKKANERFRFLTILHSTVTPSVESVKDAVEEMERAYQRTVGESGLWSRGAIELELVNLDILRRIQQAKEDEGRKYNVLLALRESVELEGLLVPKGTEHTVVLVHLHVVVDLGEDVEANEAALRKRIDRENLWSKSPYQKELKGLFKNRKIGNNLKGIADYVTKGGNDQLRYSAGFGRDLGEDIEAKIWRAGLGAAKHGGETIEDERGLTVHEVALLDELYCWLMKRRKDKRGYLIGSRER